jgi:hypothetical protein
MPQTKPRIKRLIMKAHLIKTFGTLGDSARTLNLSRWRLSMWLNGFHDLNFQEATRIRKALKVSPHKFNQIKNT